MKLVDIAASVALTFHLGTAEVSEDSLKDWLAARATGHDNLLLSGNHMKHMDPCRKLGWTSKQGTVFLGHKTRSSLFPGPQLVWIARPRVPAGASSVTLHTVIG